MGLGLPEDFIQREAACAFIDRARDQDMKQRLLMRGKRSLDETLDQALKLVFLKAAAGPVANLWEVRARASMRKQLVWTEHYRTG
jgi:hypothetical protein